MTNHGYDMISHPKATWGITEGIHLGGDDGSGSSHTSDFLLNVALNKEHQITLFLQVI